MAFPRQPVATGANGFGLVQPVSSWGAFATGCDCSALSEEGLLVKFSAG
jgi:hypothetical protein